MIYLILSILSSVGIFISFKLINTYKVKLFPAIIYNYIAASIAGFAMHKGSPVLDILNQSNWIAIAALIGLLFIMMFYTIGIATQKSGITVTSVAGKMSLIIPVIFSIIHYNEVLTTYKIAGSILALISIVLTIYKPAKTKVDTNYFYLPLIVFIGTGIIDSLIKFTQEKYLNEDVSLVFSSFVFTISGIIGLAIVLIRKKNIHQLFSLKTVALGALLGICNFGSLYFIIMAFDAKIFDSSVIFGLNNIGIVSLSVLISIGFFREKINKYNFVGIILAITSIIILTKAV